MSEDIETTAIHPVRKRGHGPMVEPIFMSSTWRLEDAGFSHSTALLAAVIDVIADFADLGATVASGTW